MSKVLCPSLCPLSKTGNTTWEVAGTTVGPAIEHSHSAGPSLKPAIEKDVAEIVLSAASTTISVAGIASKAAPKFSVGAGPTVDAAAR